MEGQYLHPPPSPLLLRFCQGDHQQRSQLWRPCWRSHLTPCDQVDSPIPWMYYSPIILQAPPRTTRSLSPRTCLRGRRHARRSCRRLFLLCDKLEEILLSLVGFRARALHTRLTSALPLATCARHCLLSGAGGVGVICPCGRCRRFTKII